MERDDVDALWALWIAPEVRRFLWDDRAITRDEAAAMVVECLAHASSGLGLWMLEPRTGTLPLGCAGLLPVSAAAQYEPRIAGLVEPLVALAPSAWGQGYASESLDAMLRHAAHTLGVRRLAGVTDVPNAASDRMLRRAGFRVLSDVAGPVYPLRTYLWDASSADPGEGG
jgi:RimJ/RimL family protein N-acetyltransferase